MKLYEVLLRRLFGSYKKNTVTNTTGYSVFQNRSNVAEEAKIYNPIGIKIGGIVNIDYMDYRDHRFSVVKIQEHVIQKDNTEHKMTDYVLLSRPIGNKEDLTIRLRVVPDPDGTAKITHRSMVLAKYDELEYDENLHNIVKNDMDFIVDDDKNDEDASNDVRDQFYRVNDISAAYTSQVKVLTDKDRDGSVSSEEVVTTTIDFWDYSRLVDFDGVETEEFLFIEMNKANGRFELWRGHEVIPERIEVF